MTWDGSGNPFYSEKTQAEIHLQALRPRNLPADGSDGRQPLMVSFSGSAAQNGPGTLSEPTGKGRDGMNAGLLGLFSLQNMGTTG